jgi:o-succinylbenzoate---CoA ligase
MNKISYKTVHNCFKMNGNHFNNQQMLEVAYSYIKEGDAYEQQVGNFFLDWFDNNSFLYLQTSGTTGAPKSIKIEKQAMVNSALATGDFFELEPTNKVLHCLPAQYIAGKMMFVRAFVLGLDIDFVHPSLHPLNKNETKYDFAAMIPLQAQNSLHKLHNIKKLIIGGVKMNPNLEKSLITVKSEIFETYGMTETITHIAAKRVGEQGFKVLPNINIKVDNRNCLVIDAPKISNDTIITNDLVEMIGKNQFSYLGRLDNVVNSGGIKLIPEQIEDKLSDKIESRFFVTGIPDNDLGEKLILVIEGNKYEVNDNIFNQLSKHQKPKEIVFVSKFQETENGKILRKESI